MRQPVVQVDAFTDRQFYGNPAAVCVMDHAADEHWMQVVAREMNQAETAFLHPAVDAADGGFHLRWFTPTVEVDLCGHATLAAAHVLWETGRLAECDAARFHTRSGLLTAVRQPDEGGWIELDFPATPAEPAAAPPELTEAIGAMGLQPMHIARSKFDYLVELDSEAAVRALVPDLARLKAVPARGVIVTARAAAAGSAPADAFDFVSRFFAPQSGVDEDPVTGSAHCALGPYWQSRLAKDRMLAYQASARGGVVRVTVRGDRIGLGGQAVTVLRGELV